MSSADKEIKSALEIALERVERLGKLSPEESRQLREKEFAAAGEALARRCVAGLPQRDVDLELDRYAGEGRSRVARHLCRDLLDSLDLEDTEATGRALDTIQHLSEGSAMGQRLRSLLAEYRQGRDEAWQEAQRSLAQARRERLAGEGISGTAVEPNIEASPEWRQTLQRLQSGFRGRLDSLKASCEGR